MHHLYTVYFVNQPLHDPGIFVAHHQEVHCIYTAIGTYTSWKWTTNMPGTCRRWL